MESIAKNIISNSVETVLTIVEEENTQNMLCTPDIYLFLSTMNYDNFTLIINLLTNQKWLTNNPEYFVYSFDCNTNKTTRTNETTTEFDDLYHGRIEYDTYSERFKMRFISPDVFKEYMLINNNVNRYSFFPIVLKINTKNVFHQICAAFDNINKKVYLVDPNGTVTYFNASTMNDVDDDLYFIHEKHAELMIIAYLQELANVGLQYEFVPTNIWNYERYIINRHFIESEIGRGHCVIVFLMIIHIMSTIKIEPTNLFELFYHFEDAELMSLINDYSVGVYKMFQKN